MQRADAPMYASVVAYPREAIVEQRGTVYWTLEDLQYNQFNALGGDGRRREVPLMLEHSRLLRDRIGTVRAMYLSGDNDLMASIELDRRKYPRAREVYSDWKHGRRLGVSIGVHDAFTYRGHVYGKRIQELSVTDDPAFERARIQKFYTNSSYADGRAPHSRRPLQLAFSVKRFLQANRQSVRAMSLSEKDAAAAQDESAPAAAAEMTEAQHPTADDGSIVSKFFTALKSEPTMKELKRLERERETATRLSQLSEKEREEYLARLSADAQTANEKFAQTVYKQLQTVLGEENVGALKDPQYVSQNADPILETVTAFSKSFDPKLQEERRKTAQLEEDNRQLRERLQKMQQEENQHKRQRLDTLSRLQVVYSNAGGSKPSAAATSRAPAKPVDAAPASAGEDAPAQPPAAKARRLFDPSWSGTPASLPLTSGWKSMINRAARQGDM